MNTIIQFMMLDSPPKEGEVKTLRTIPYLFSFYYDGALPRKKDVDLKIELVERRRPPPEDRGVVRASASRRVTQKQLKSPAKFGTAKLISITSEPRKDKRNITSVMLRLPDVHVEAMWRGRKKIRVDGHLPKSIIAINSVGRITLVFDESKGVRGKTCEIEYPDLSVKMKYKLSKQ